MDDLGRRLRRIRENRKLSIYDVERRTGLHFSTISKYERNERQPSLEALRELAAVYQVPVTALIADQVDLQAVLPPRIATLAAALLERPELVEACEQMMALDRHQLAALVAFLDSLGVTGGRATSTAQAKPMPVSKRRSSPRPESTGGPAAGQAVAPSGSAGGAGDDPSAGPATGSGPPARRHQP